MRRFVAVLLSVFAVAATGVVGFALAGPAQQKATAVTDVTVHGGEYYFTLDKTSAPVGVVNFHFVNDGDVSHDFSIAGQKTPIIDHGQTATLTVNFSQPGNYGYICTVGEHAVYGMTGNFQITGQAVTTVVTSNGTTVTQTTTPPPPPEEVHNVLLPS
jgi:plastocyanin